MDWNLTAPVDVQQMFLYFYSGGSKKSTQMPLQVRSLPATPALLRGRAWREASGDDSPGRWGVFPGIFGGIIPCFCRIKNRFGGEMCSMVLLELRLFGAEMVQVLDAFGGIIQKQKMEPGNHAKWVDSWNHHIIGGAVFRQLLLDGKRIAP